MPIIKGTLLKCRFRIFFSTIYGTNLRNQIPVFSKNLRFSFMDPRYVRILRLLYESRFNIFNTRNTPLSLRLIAERTQLEISEAEDICADLVEEGLIEVEKLPGRRYFYRITEKGILSLEELFKVGRLRAEG